MNTKVILPLIRYEYKMSHTLHNYTQMQREMWSRSSRDHACMHALLQIYAPEEDDWMRTPSLHSMRAMQGAERTGRAHGPFAGGHGPTEYEGPWKETPHHTTQHVLHYKKD